jgi:hypothetical protein
MAEYSRMAKGSFTAVGTSAIINLPFQPDYVELWNYTNINAGPVDNKVCKAWWDSGFVTSSTNPTMVELYNASGVINFDTITTSGISNFAAGQLLQYGARQQIVSATAANPAVFTVTAHGYNVGDTVVFQGLYQSSTTGMAQMCGPMFTISAVTANTFTVKWNASTSAYTALSGSPTGAYVKKVLYPFIYVPQVSTISALTLASTTTVVTTAYHNFRTGQQVAFRIPPAWGTYQLNSLPNSVIPGSPMYGYVVSVTDNWTFVVNINSSAFTAYTANQTIASVPGLTFPQVLAVGDVNTGGDAITAGSPLYPSPTYPTSTNGVSTINGPAIRGAFVNNTSQGFLIGTGLATTNTSAQLLTSGDIVLWHAYIHDYGNP